MKCDVCNGQLENGCPFCNNDYVSPSVKELLMMDTETREAHIKCQFLHSMIFDIELFEANEFYEEDDDVS